MGAGSVVAVLALVVGIWVGINLGSSGPASVVAASYDTGIQASSHPTADGFGKVKGAACSGSYEE